MSVIINMAHLFTASLCCGYFPENMKAAILISVGKPGKSKFNPSNYRPISLLSMVIKIYEKILTARLTKFLEDKGIEHENQYGFRNGRSTTSCIAMNYEFISRHRTTHEHYKISVIGRDIKGAFNHLWHPRVKWHLLNIGLPTILAKTLCNFLDNRTARIRVGKHIGDPIQILAGVPQGASPSAKIFNLVIRLSPLPPEAMYHQYDSNFADDCTQIIVTPCSKKRGSSLHEIQMTRAIERQNEFELQEGLITEPS